VWGRKGFCEVAASNIKLSIFPKSKRILNKFKFRKRRNRSTQDICNKYSGAAKRGVSKARVVLVVTVRPGGDG
jgi:hypothetical protein